MCYKSFFYTKSQKNYIDPDREEYQKFFNIIDDYLIEYSIIKEEGGEKTGYIVYIDPENDIDWKDTRTKRDWTDDDNIKWSQCLARLSAVHAEPTGHLSFETIRAFKLKLGVGYVLAMNKCFNEVDKVIETSLNFIHQRNAEKSRQIFLVSSTIIIGIIFLLWILNHYCLNSISEEWALSFLFGALGAYTSIWTRYGKLTMSGLSTKLLHYLETLARIIIGIISASVIILAIRCGFVFSIIAETTNSWIFGLCSFAAGFSERIIPSLIEVFSKQITK